MEWSMSSYACLTSCQVSDWSLISVTWGDWKPSPKGNSYQVMRSTKGTCKESRNPSSHLNCWSSQKRMCLILPVSEARWNSLFTSKEPGARISPSTLKPMMKDASRNFHHPTHPSPWLLCRASSFIAFRNGGGGVVEETSLVMLQKLVSQFLLEGLFP